MPRWFSIVVLATVLVIVLHTLISFFQPMLAPWGRPPADIVRSPGGNPLEKQAQAHAVPVDGNANANPQSLKTGHGVEKEGEEGGPKGHEILLMVGSDGKSRSNIVGLEDMVRENRQQYAELHGQSPCRRLLFLGITGN